MGAFSGAIVVLFLLQNPNDNFIATAVDTYLNKFDGYIPETDEEDDYDYTIEVHNSVQNPIIYSDFFNLDGSTSDFILTMTNYVNSYEADVDGHTVNNYDMTKLGYFESNMIFTNNSGVPLTLNYEINFIVLDNLSLKYSPKISGTTGVVQSGDTVSVTENTLDYVTEYPGADNFNLFTTVPVFQFWIDDGDPKEGAQNWKGARAGKTNEKVFFDWQREYGTWSKDSTTFPEYNGGFIPETEMQMLDIYPMGSEIETDIINSMVNAYENGKDIVSTIFKVIFYIALFVLITIASLFIIVVIYFISNAVVEYKKEKAEIMLAEGKIDDKNDTNIDENLNEIDEKIDDNIDNKTDST